MFGDLEDPWPESVKRLADVAIARSGSLQRSFPNFPAEQLRVRCALSDPGIFGIRILEKLPLHLVSGARWPTPPFKTRQPNSKTHRHLGRHVPLGLRLILAWDQGTKMASHLDDHRNRGIKDTCATQRVHGNAEVVRTRTDSDNNIFLSSRTSPNIASGTVFRQKKNSITAQD
jgi:hypothetical protein